MRAGHASLGQSISQDSIRTTSKRLGAGDEPKVIEVSTLSVKCLWGGVFQLGKSRVGDTRDNQQPAWGNSSPSRQNTTNQQISPLQTTHSSTLTVTGIYIMFLSSAFFNFSLGLLWVAWAHFFLPYLSVLLRQHIA